MPSMLVRAGLYQRSQNVRDRPRSILRSLAAYKPRRQLRTLHCGANSIAGPILISGLQREEPIALNYMRHTCALVRDPSGGGDGKPTAMVAEELARDFRSLDQWRDELAGMATGAAGGAEPA